MCRTFPRVYNVALLIQITGIDGFRKYSGKRCCECRCTPCLINHNSVTHFMTVNGKEGWEDDTHIEDGGNSLGPRIKSRRN